MRIRIQTHKPLPDVKAWFVPDEHNIPETIYELKEELCGRVQALKAAQYHGQNLILLLDDFELLDDSPFGAVRDGDLICIKSLPPKGNAADIEMRSPQAESHERKRKRSLAPVELVPVARKNAVVAVKPRVVRPPVKKVEEESESESDASTSSSSSSSSSTSTSSKSSKSSTSSDSSSSSSSSSTSSIPKPQPSKKPRITPSSIPKANTNVTHVPPGYGKPATHSRNKRRRQKREHEKLQVGTSIPLSTANATQPLPRAPVSPASVPLPPSPSAGAPAAQKTLRVDAPPAPSGPVYITQEQVMMSSMRNKNKKKGFKLSMASPIPQKIIFSSAAVVAPAAAAGTKDGDGMHVDTLAPAPASASPSKHFNAVSRAPSARLVPPSEIQATHPERLPRNMIVTSVDVEAGMWDNSATYAEPARKKKRGKKAVQLDEEYYADDGEEYYADDGGWGGGAVPASLDEAGPAVLDYGETDAVGDGVASFDWDRAERLWGSRSTVLTGPEQLVAGALVGWKALAINPRTFSPEVLLSVARVVQPPDITTGKGVLIRQIQRPTDSENAFAFGFTGSSGDGEWEEEGEEHVEWRDVLAAEWRLLDL